MMKMRSGGKQKKRDIPRVTWEGIWRDLPEPKKRKKNTTMATTTVEQMTMRNLSSISQSFVSTFVSIVSPLSPLFPFCFALQMSNGCVLRATSKILYYRWVYNIVSSLFLTLMIVGGNSSWLCLYKVLGRDGSVRDT